MKSHVPPLLGAFAFLFLASSALYDDPTAYELLESYGFPEGLLPDTVSDAGQDYSLDSDGKFSLHLEQSCKFTISGSYEVKYSPRITGTIAYDRLRNLGGISVHLLFVWWNIDAITVSGIDLVFQVGPFSASFPADNFSENPYCGGRMVDKLYRKELVTRPV